MYVVVYHLCFCIRPSKETQEEGKKGKGPLANKFAFLPMCLAAVFLRFLCVVAGFIRTANHMETLQNHLRRYRLDASHATMEPRLCRSWQSFTQG